MIVKNTAPSVMRKMKTRFLPLAIMWIVLGCSGKGRRNDLRPLSDGLYDEEYQQHIVITDDSIKPFEVESEEACLHVELPQKMQSTRLDTVFSSYSFVRLETSEKCLVGHIDRIIKCPGCYCILDRDNANVFIFEENGRFRCKLGSKGHARNEHLDAWNIAYDEKNNHIVLLDLTGRRLQSYDLNGNLKKVAPIYFLYTDMAYSGDGMLCMAGSSYNETMDIIDKSGLIYADRNQKPQRVGFPTTEEKRKIFTYSDEMRGYKDKAYFDDLVSDTIWEVSGARMLPLVVMTANGKPHFSKDEKERMSDEIFRRRFDETPVVTNFQITSRYVALEVPMPHTGLGETVFCSRTSRRRKILGLPVGEVRLGDFLASNTIDEVFDESTFISVLQPVCFLPRIEKEQAMGKSMTENERRIFQNIQPDDNPLLMLSRLVDF